MKYYPLLIVFLLSAQIHAQESTEASAETETMPRLTSPSSDQKRADFYRFSQMLKRVTSGAQNVSEIMLDKPTGQGAVCAKFVSKNELGVWGEIIKEQNTHKKITALYGIKGDPEHQGPRDLVKLCPNYPAMENDDKDALWALIISTMSFKESTCQPDEYLRQRKKGPGAAYGAPNGTAYGLMQLDKWKEASYSPGCRDGDALKPDTNLRCGLAMMNDQVNRDGNLFSQKSYWSTLRPMTKDEAPYSLKIMKDICKYEACGIRELCEEQVATYISGKPNRPVAARTKVRTASASGRAAQ